MWSLLRWILYVLIVGELMPRETVYIADPLYTEYLLRRRAAERGVSVQSLLDATPMPMDTLDTHWRAQ